MVGVVTHWRCLFALSLPSHYMLAYPRSTLETWPLLYIVFIPDPLIFDILSLVWHNVAQETSYRLTI